MNNGLAGRLQRGVAFGLALFLFATPVPADSAFDRVKRQHKHESFIVVEWDGSHRVLFLDGFRKRSAVIRKSTDPESLYDAVDQDDPLVITRLSHALGAPGRETRLTAIRLLGEIDAPDARAALETVLHQPDVELRIEVVESIADTPGAEMLLQIASADSAEPVATLASEYLNERRSP